MNTEQPIPAEQKTTAQELIAANIRAPIEQLEAGNSDALTAYLDAMSRFHRYSFGNVLSIARQRPGATHVAGFHAWRQLGRTVKKGERGIRILAPIITKRKQKDEAEKGNMQPNRTRLVGFRNAYVFDVSQTEGAEFPAIRGIGGDVGANRGRLFAFVEQQGIELAFSESIAPALGMSYGGRIALLPGQSKAEEFSTLVHELAHELLHRTERRIATTKVMRETEAEAVAFIVGKAVGLDTGTASADYIRLYDGNAALLTESLEVIQHASAVILAALESRPSEAEESQLAQAS
jgi:antirestriction protein ArdC